MRKILSVLVAASALALVAAPASATVLSFGFIPIGTVSLTPGPDITIGNVSKTLPAAEMVNTIATPLTATPAGISLFTPVGLNVLTIPTSNGPFSLVVTVGLETFSFSHILDTSITATSAGAGGNLSLDMTGSVTGGLYLGQSASFSESCTQSGPGASINCSDSITTPSTINTPEPLTLAMFGAGLAGLGARRRRKSA